jgi:hypothetical protein
LTFYQTSVKLSRPRKNLLGYRGMILSGKLSMSIISLLAAVMLNALLQIPTPLGNALTIIAVDVVQKVNVRL